MFDSTSHAAAAANCGYSLLFSTRLCFLEFISLLSHRALYSPYARVEAAFYASHYRNGEFFFFNCFCWLVGGSFHFLQQPHEYQSDQNTSTHVELWHRLIFLFSTIVLNSLPVHVESPFHIYNYIKWACKSGKLNSLNCEKKCVQFELKLWSICNGSPFIHFMPNEDRRNEISQINHKKHDEA